VTQEELQKERRRVKELNQTKAALEKDTTRLGSELKALGERSEKVRPSLSRDLQGVH
jgi:predicted  nucleic acid-binding Zn-ribbon protein